MIIKQLLNIFEKNRQREAIIWRSMPYKYEHLIIAVTSWSIKLKESNVTSGSVVAIQADFSPNSIALLIALAEQNCNIVPLTLKNKTKREEICQIAQVEYFIEVDLFDNVTITRLDSVVNHELILQLKEKNISGLIIFSSGSTGKSKGAVHDFTKLFERHIIPGRTTRVLAFLLFDHIGGLNTLFYTLFNGGCLVIAESRTPKMICEAIANFKVKALTTTPTFLNLLLLSDFQQYDLSSLQFINYSTEVMPENTLQALRIAFPQVRLSQAYGLSEIGVLPVTSKSSDSLYIKIDTNRCKARIVNGLLEIKSYSSMLGYLNAPSPYTGDGWFITGDAVEVDGDYIRVLGRQSDLINVGGEKVYPAEIENVLQKIDGVEQVSVFAEKNTIMGQIIVAKVKLLNDESVSDIKRRIQLYCKDRLSSYKIPQKVIISHEILHNDRFKTLRKQMESST